MTISRHIFEFIRAALELAYYAAGVALAYLAYRGLAQIKLTKELAATSAKREAFKLAVERGHISEIECGKRIVNLLTLQTLAACFDTTMSALLKGL